MSSIKISAPDVETEIEDGEIYVGKEDDEIEGDVEDCRVAELLGWSQPHRHLHSVALNPTK